MTIEQLVRQHVSCRTAVGETERALEVSPDGAFPVAYAPKGRDNLESFTEVPC